MTKGSLDVFEYVVFRATKEKDEEPKGEILGAGSVVAENEEAARIEAIRKVPHDVPSTAVEVRVRRFRG